MASSSSTSFSSPVRLRQLSGLPLPTPLLLLLLLLLSSITLSVAQWTLIGDFEPGRGSDQQRQMALDEWQGKTSAIQMFFTSWATNEMTWMWTSLATIYSQGHIPIISWEPWQYQGKLENTSLLLSLPCLLSTRSRLSSILTS
jgi:hypothetical protein